MLWYKGWLETRFRLLFPLGFFAFLITFAHLAGAKPPPPGARPVEGLLLMGQSFVVVTLSMLAGAGINTQPGFQASKGLHGSTLFTLSLPVSRLRLLATRSGIGWLAMAGVMGVFCAGLWSVLPRNSGVTQTEMLQYAGTVIACSSAFYFLSVLLATFLDDQWRIWGTMLIYGAYWALSSYFSFPAAVNLIRATAEGSPVIAHTVPWAAIAFSLALSAILFFVALKIAEGREY